MNKITCKQCNYKGTENDLIQTKQEMSNGKYHIRGECPKCHRWVKFISQDNSYMKEKIHKDDLTDRFLKKNKIGKYHETPKN